MTSFYFKSLTVKGYKVNDLYNKLKELHEKVRWANQVWNNLNLPNHAFILWLTMKGQLQTKERIIQYFPIDSKCELCRKEDESITHLFF